MLSEKSAQLFFTFPNFFHEAFCFYLSMDVVL